MMFYGTLIRINDITLEEDVLAPNTSFEVNSGIFNIGNYTRLPFSTMVSYSISPNSENSVYSHTVPPQ